MTVMRDRDDPTEDQRDLKQMAGLPLDILRIRNLCKNEMLKN